MAESDLEKSAEFTQIFNKHGIDEDPVIAAQRFLNIFRQLHIFTPAKRKEFDEMILKQPAVIKGMFASLPGGSVLQEYVNNLEQNAGMEQTKAKVIATSPEISDEISKAKILASALAEAQSQMHPSGQGSSADMQEIGTIASQLRKEIRNLKQDFEEIKENQVKVDLSKMPTETLNKIQQSIERKFSGGGSMSLSGPLKIIADESLKKDLVQIITEALKTNAETQAAGNREFAEIIGASQQKIAEMINSSNQRLLEMSFVPSNDFDHRNVSQPDADAFFSSQADNLGNIIAAVLRENNQSSTQMFIETLKSFQQENMKILEAQTELQKALLDVSRSIRGVGENIVNDELNLESLDSDFENEVPAQVIIPEEYQKQPVPSSAEKTPEVLSGETETSPSPASGEDAADVSESTTTETPPPSEEKEEEPVLSADDLFADIDGTGRKRTDGEGSAKKRKRKKKKKNKEENAEAPEETSTKEDKQKFVSDYNTVSSEANLSAPSGNPISVSSSKITGNPLFASFSSAAEMAETVNTDDDDDAAGWGFSTTSAAPEEPQVQPPHFDFSQKTEEFPAPQKNAEENVEDSVQDDYADSSAEDEQEWEWEYVEEDDSDNNTYSQTEASEPVEYASPAQAASSEATDDNQEWEWEYEYVDESDNADSSAEDGQEWEWEYVEDDSDADNHNNSSSSVEKSPDFSSSESVYNETPDDVSSENEEIFQESNSDMPEENTDISENAAENFSPDISDDNDESENPVDEEIPDGGQSEDGENPDGNVFSESDDISDNVSEKETEPVQEESFADLQSPETLQKDDMPDFQIAGLSSGDDDDPFADK